MNDLISTVNNTINSKLIIPIISNEITISEDKDNTKCKQISLRCGNKNRFIAFTLDTCIPKNNHRFPFFNQAQGIINKANDGIILHIKDNELYVLLVELKSDNLGMYLKQLKCGISFTKYLINIINIAFNKSYTLNESNIRCIIASTRKTVRKTGTKRENINFNVIDNLLVTEQQCNQTQDINKYFKN